MELISKRIFILVLIFPLCCIETGFGQLTPSLPKVFDAANPRLAGPELMKEAGIMASAHQIPDSKAQWEEYRKQLKQKVMEKAAVVIDHQLPLNYKELNTREREGYTVKNIMFQSHPGVYAVATLYVPKGNGPFPAALLMMGHYTSGRVSEEPQKIGAALALNGYVSLNIDPFGSGERATAHFKPEYHGGNLGASLMNTGKTLMGMQIVDNMRAIDLLCSLPYVDKNKIGATGCSGGGNQTMWLSALDERVSVSVPVVSVGTFESYVMNSNCICELLPDGLTLTEAAGLLGLVAPRPLKICTALQEEIKAFLPVEMFRTYKNLRPVYDMYDANEKLTYFLADVTHGYKHEFVEAMLGWFDLYLKGKGTGAPRYITEQFHFFPVNEAIAFESGKRDPLVQTIADYCRTNGARLRTEMLAAKKIDVEAKKKELALLLRLSPDAKIEKVERFAAAQNWERLVIETSFGSAIPVLYRAPTGKENIFIIACDIQGKNGVNPEIYSPSRLQGAGVVLLDLFGTGESYSENATQKNNFHDMSRGMMWLGKRSLGQWVAELEMVVRYLTDEQGATAITIHAGKETGLAALFLATLNDRLTGLELSNTPVSYQFDQPEGLDFFTMAIHLPGILQWGDVSLAAALSGKDITFINPVTMSGKPLSQPEKNAFQKEFAAMRKLCRQKGNTFFIYQKE